MKKYIVPICMLTLVIPSIALASWWNPFSWFNKQSSHKEVPSVIVQPQPLPSIETLTSFPVSTPEIKKEVPKTIKPKVVVPASTSTIIVPSKLSILNISIDASVNSAKIKWETSIASESKVFINGETYFSKSGVNTKHYVDLTNLKSNTLYNGTTTAIANNSWKSQDFNFITKPIPLSITVTEKTCSSESCTISWETNYDSSGKIEIYKTSSNKIVKSSDYTLSNENSLRFNVEPDTEYNFKISASSSTESTEFTNNFKSYQTPPPPPAPIDMCLNISGVQTTVPDGMTNSGGNCIKSIPIPTPSGGCGRWVCSTVSA